MDSLVSSLGLNLVDICVAIVNFLILLFVLKFVLFKPLFEALDRRKKRIADDIESAESMKAEMTALREELLKERAEAKQSAQDIIARATKAGDAAKESIISEAKAEAAGILVKAQEDIREEKEKALSQIRGEAASLAILAASKLVGRSLDDNDHRELVDKYIEEAGEIQ